MSTAENHAPEHAHGGDHGHGHDHAHDHGPQGFLAKYVFPLDHKMIAFQYLFTGMAMALIGGFTVYAFRMQLAFPGQHVPGFGVVSPDQYNMLVTSHGSVMIFWVAMPVLIAAFGNYLIPLMIGADDMVFPRLNRLSYQIFLISALVLIASFFVEGNEMKRKHPGRFSNFMERNTARRIACMASGATTRSTWNRQCLAHSIKWLTAPTQYAAYAVAGC